MWNIILLQLVVIGSNQNSDLWIKLKLQATHKASQISHPCQARHEMFSNSLFEINPHTLFKDCFKCSSISKLYRACTFANEALAQLDAHENRNAIFHCLLQSTNTATNRKMRSWKILHNDKLPMLSVAVQSLCEKQICLFAPLSDTINTGRQNDSIN